MKGLGAKILAVMAEVGKVEKDKRNDFHKYDYASDEAVVGAIRGAMIKHRLVALPNQVSCQVDGELTTIKVEYSLLDVDSGETLPLGVYGQGADKGDKGAYKAATGAEKYFLLKTFLIATGDDAEKESPERSRKPQTPARTDSGTPELKTATASFILSDPIKSKKGTIYRKALDKNGTSFYVWDDAVCADLQIANGAPVTVEYEAGQYPTIKRVIQNQEAA